MQVTDPTNKLPLLSGRTFQKMGDVEGGYFMPREGREFTGATLMDNGDGFHTVSNGQAEATGYLNHLIQEFKFKMP